MGLYSDPESTNKKKNYIDNQKKMSLMILVCVCVCGWMMVVNK